MDSTPTSEPTPEPGHSSRRIARSTAVFSLATAISRVLGLVREMVSAYFFGVTGLINAFTVAILIPNVVRALLADAALSGAFVPVFSDLLEKGERQRAWRVASTLFWLTLLVLGGVTALFILLAPLLMRPFGDPGGDYDLAVGLSRVLFPIVVLLGLSGIVVGILNTYHQFAVPALAPVAWNVVIVVGLLLGVPQLDDESAELYLYAGVVVVATLVQLLLPIPWLRRLDGRLTMVVDWRDPAVKRVLVLMLPVTLTIGLVNVNFLVDTLFASRLLDPELAPAAIDKAFRLYMLPQGIFAVAVTTVLLPDARQVRSAHRHRRAAARARRRVAPDRLPPRARRPVVDRPRRADRASRLPARRVHRRRHGDRRPVPAGVLDRARLQRLDADPQPELLRGADELGADRDRSRGGRAQRRAQHCLLPVRDLGHPALDVDGERRRGGRAPRDDAPPDRTRARRSHARRGRAGRGGRSGRCGTRVRRLVRARRGARPGPAGSDPLARRGVRRRRARVRRALAGARAARARGVATVAAPARRLREER